MSKKVSFVEKAGGHSDSASTAWSATALTCALPSTANSFLVDSTLLLSPTASKRTARLICSSL